jgi:hypothetical protein
MTVKRSDREARWWRRKRVEAEPSSRVEPEPKVAEIAVAEIPRPEPEPEPEPVTPERPLEREWNIWDLERLAREQAGDTARDQEWAALFMHLRQFANADGVLPTQFDGLVRESFSRLIQAA